MNKTLKQKKRALKQSITRLSDEMARSGFKKHSDEESISLFSKETSGRRSKDHGQEKRPQERKPACRQSSFFKMPPLEIPKLTLIDLKPITEADNPTQNEPTSTLQHEEGKEELSDDAFSSNEEESSLCDTQEEFPDSCNKEYNNTDISGKHKTLLTIYEKAKINSLYHDIKIMRIKNQRMLKEREELDKRPRVLPKSESMNNKKGYDYKPIYQRSSMIMTQKKAKIYLKQKMLENDKLDKELNDCLQPKVNKTQADIDNFIEFQFRWKEKVDFDRKMKTILNNDSFIEQLNPVRPEKSHKASLSQEQYCSKVVLDIEKRKENRRLMEEKYCPSFKPVIYPFNPEKFKQKTESLSNISTKAQMSNMKITEFSPHYAINKNPNRYYKVKHREMIAPFPVNSLTNVNHHPLQQITKKNRSMELKPNERLETQEDINNTCNIDNSPQMIVREVTLQNELKRNSKHLSTSSIESNQKDCLHRRLYKVNVSTTSSNGKYINPDIIPSRRTFNMLLEK